MPWIDAKCTNCGAALKVDYGKDAAICQFCGSAFIVEKAINNYITQNNTVINADTVHMGSDSCDELVSAAMKFINSKEFAAADNICKKMYLNFESDYRTYWIDFLIKSRNMSASSCWQCYETSEWQHIAKRAITLAEGENRESIIQKYNQFVEACKIEEEKNCSRLYSLAVKCLHEKNWAAASNICRELNTLHKSDYRTYWVDLMIKTKNLDARSCFSSPNMHIYREIARQAISRAHGDEQIRVKSEAEDFFEACRRLQKKKHADEKIIFFVFIFGALVIIALLFFLNPNSKEPETKQIETEQTETEESEAFSSKNQEQNDSKIKNENLITVGKRETIGSFSWREINNWDKNITSNGKTICYANEPYLVLLVYNSTERENDFNSIDDDSYIELTKACFYSDDSDAIADNYRISSVNGYRICELDYSHDGYYGKSAMFSSGKSVFILSVLEKEQASDNVATIYNSLLNTVEITNDEDEEKNIDDLQTELTLGEQNALKSAKQYISMMAFSESGLKEQLVKGSGYTEEETEFAVKSCGADWNEQAAKSAKQYLSVMSFSRENLKEQLIKGSGFTEEQAEYGVVQAGY